MQLGLEPVSGPTEDGARQFLFRRADADRAKLRPLKQFVRGEKASRGIGEVQWLVIVIGRALPQCLGHAFTQTSSRFVSKDGGTTVQVVTGRRKGFSGRFAFVVSATQIRRLEDATDGYLALGFVGQENFLLIPWKEASSLLRLRSTGDGADVYLDPDALGSSHALGLFAVPLA